MTILMIMFIAVALTATFVVQYGAGRPTRSR